MKTRHFTTRELGKHEDHYFESLATRIKYFSTMLMKPNKEYLATMDKDEIVALAELEPNPHDSNQYWLTFLSVDERYRNKGLAKKLAEEVAKYVSKKGKTLKLSSYTDMGQKYLKPIFGCLSKKYQILETKYLGPYIDEAETKSGEEITFKYHKDVEGDNNIGWIVHRIDAFVDGKNVGYIKISYIPKKRFEKWYPGVFNFLSSIKGMHILPYRNRAKDWKGLSLKEKRAGAGQAMQELVSWNE